MEGDRLFVSGIGNVLLKRNRRAKNITLRILPGPKVILSGPTIISEKKARRILLEREDWILKKISDPSFKTNRYKIGDCISTLHHNIEITSGTNYIKEAKYTIQIGEGVDVNSDETQNRIKIRIREMMRAEAKAYLPQRTAWLAQRFNFSYARVSIKDSKTRWGSCSLKKNINLSLYLMRLPEHLIDYVILHELCHTIHMNHGEEFHALMNRISNNKEKELRRELRNHRTGL